MAAMCPTGSPSMPSPSHGPLFNLYPAVQLTRQAQPPSQPRQYRRTSSIFRTVAPDCHIAVPGSSRLDVSRRGGDSLMGRNSLADCAGCGHPGPPPPHPIKAPGLQWAQRHAYLPENDYRAGGRTD